MYQIATIPEGHREEKQHQFEIGRRLKHVKENDLAHGEWSDWLQSINMSRGQSTKFIKVSDEFSNDSPVNHLGIKTLYQLAKG
nr:MULTISPECIES: DUF3102 domain-containing protein [unclassified Staphylococcus]